MFGAKHSKTNRLQKTIECKTNEQSTKCLYCNTEIEIQLGKILALLVVLVVFASTKLALNYITQARCN